MQASGNGQPSYLIDLDGISKDILNVSERTTRKMVVRPDFPKAVELAPRVKRWVRHEVEAYVANMLPRVELGEPPQLTRAREAKAAGRQIVGEPFMTAQ